MIMIEFYKQKLIKIDNKIQTADKEKDYKRLTELKDERVEIERRIKEIKSGNYI
ncbi:hypothetical protein KM792_14430 [Clostridium tyrobutyricum]|uniref:hypothetical protein n=1 Tax=Clostridium tyrobutyricum TaxID=1519 RepID=UPI00030AA37D|nr:hypothetical protein [Clostridium tyrobutyricum]MBR9648020.1 hypothetical protein [Clostridium tyrobutyricum]MBV4417630.1 hypothetical protein [Clostridium tyrobutyricum]MBV4421236.1 hypothetical protein [Clostridium tyrobutyricum]MBV4421240.1 hypothetical protein [Clostridium tyrobutyricum]MBV4424501.1 hypothetical protein [Clostridium tyrobutyricum]